MVSKSCCNRRYEMLTVRRTGKVILISPFSRPNLLTLIFHPNSSYISVELFLPCNLKFALHNNESALRWNREKMNGPVDMNYLIS